MPQQQELVELYVQDSENLAEVRPELGQVQLSAVF